MEMVFFSWQRTFSINFWGDLFELRLLSVLYIFFFVCFIIIWTNAVMYKVLKFWFRKTKFNLSKALLVLKFIDWSGLFNYITFAIFFPIYKFPHYKQLSFRASKSIGNVDFVLRKYCEQHFWTNNKQILFNGLWNEHSQTMLNNEQIFIWFLYLAVMCNV